MMLSDIAIRRPVFAWMLMAALVLFGMISYFRLGVSMLPEVESPNVSISLQWPGAAPEVIETEIVDRMEQAIINVSGIKEITSNIRQGTANINIELELNRNVDAALLEVQSLVSRVRLPVDVEPPIITKNNTNDQPIMWIGVRSEKRSIRDLIVFADLNLRDKFQVLPGVGEVILGGFAERNLRIWVDNQKLKENELTVLDVQAAIRNDHVETAAGTIENQKQEINIRAMGEALTPAAVANILITQRGGRPIYNTTLRVGDVATIEDGLNDIRRISHITGVQGVGLGIKKQRGANSTEVADTVKEQLIEVQKSLPPDVEMQINFDMTTFIKESIHETTFTLWLSALLTALICYLFLGSWSSTFNILLSIPTSVIGTFTVMYFFGFTLNMFTLLGLALAIGIVVDDAIMVLENIVRHHEMGKDRVSAARDGAREITFAAVAATIAVVAIFLPVAFMQGVIGRFFYEFGVTISAAVVLSLVEAITLTPMRCSQFLHVERTGWLPKRVDKIVHSWAVLYRSALVLCLNNRVIVVIVSFMFFFLTMLIPIVRHPLKLGTGKNQPLLQKEFSPAQDQSMFMIRFETPVGSSLDFTVAKLREIENYVKEKRPEVIRYFAAVGGFTGGEVNSGILFLTLKPKNERTLRQTEIIEEVRVDLQKIKEAKIVPIDLSRGGFNDRGRSLPIEFSIQGGEWKVLLEKSAEMNKRLNATGLVTELDSNYREGQPELQIVPNRDKAAARGVSMDAIARTVGSAIGGIREGKYTSEGRRYDIRIRLMEGQRNQTPDVLNLQVRNQFGELVPITEVVDTRMESTLQTINRRNRERSISLFSNIAVGHSQAEVLSAIESIAKEILPAGYRIKFTDQAQNLKDANKGLLFAFVVGILVAYMVLASQFNSFVHPITILLGMFFGLSGAFIALVLTGNTLNFYSMIGIILLMGIVKKNSILLVEFTNHVRETEGLSVRDAILKASPIRLRPILMTSFATIAAAIPPALAFGPGAESRVPMSITIIGGVAISTFFSLLVVPSVYSLFSQMEKAKPIKTDL
ncbi:MAG: efflux RND transporter permease subunit [Verrucomicrobiota bacterium]|nr:efflux RND transporter permease subunit [Verrucomicrobiota bacterium]